MTEWGLVSAILLFPNNSQVSTFNSQGKLDGWMLTPDADKSIAALPSICWFGASSSFPLLYSACSCPPKIHMWNSNPPGVVLGGGACGSPQELDECLYKRDSRDPESLPVVRPQWEAAGSEPGRGPSPECVCWSLDLGFKAVRKKCLLFISPGSVVLCCSSLNRLSITILFPLTQPWGQTEKLVWHPLSRWIKVARVSGTM